MRRLWLIALLLVSAGCQRSSDRTSSPPGLSIAPSEDEEAILDLVVAALVSPSRPLVLSQTGRRHVGPADRAADISPEEIADFSSRNRDSIPLGAALDRAISLSPTESDEAIRTRGWSGFKMTFLAPAGLNGFYVLSRPGFDRDHQRAILTIDWICGEACAIEFLEVLEKRNGKWEISRSEKIWED